MLDELQTVVLSHDVKEYALYTGDVGAVVHRYSDGEAYEVEFVTAGGDTLAVLTLSESDIRPMHQHEILHARTTVAA